MWQDRKIIAENWRALELKSVLGELSQNTSILNSQMNDLEHQKFCKSVTVCNDGWLHGSNCENSTQQCAVLLADFPGKFQLPLKLIWISVKFLPDQGGQEAQSQAD